jgi:hypothetical protein
MDGDEFLFLIVSLVLALAALARWYSIIGWLNRLRPCLISRTLLGLLPIACLAAVWPVLHYWADPQVTQAPEYQLLFMMGAGMWLWVPMLLLPVLGISLRSDAIERGNGAAALVVGAATIAVMTIYASANIGSGPTIWTTIGPAALGTLAIATVWFAHRLLSPAWEDVAIGRDTAAAVRVGAFLLATAMIIAPPLAGDWVSATDTWNDLLRRGWPVLFLAAGAAVLDRMLTPTKNRPSPDVAWAGIVAGVGLISVAGLVAAALL